MAFYNSNPSPEELAEWLITATRRYAILPARIEIRGHYTTITCGQESCRKIFTRKLLPKRNDPVFICPECRARNYLPVQW